MKLLHNHDVAYLVEDYSLDMTRTSYNFGKIPSRYIIKFPEGTSFTFTANNAYIGTDDVSLKDDILKKVPEAELTLGRHPLYSNINHSNVQKHSISLSWLFECDNNFYDIEKFLRDNSCNIRCIQRGNLNIVVFAVDDLNDMEYLLTTIKLFGGNLGSAMLIPSFFEEEKFIKPFHDRANEIIHSNTGIEVVLTHNNGESREKHSLDR